MKGKAYVINLKRRDDRLKRFQEFYSQFGPDLPLTIFEAIDGSQQDYLSRVSEELLKNVSQENDYNNKPTITATTYSHMSIWKELVESDDGEENTYAMIFEDDCYFRPELKDYPEISRESLKTKWPKILKEFEPKFNDEKSILYSGAGDILPISVNIPSESLLIAQEMNHVLKNKSNGGGGKYYGIPNFNSPYVFSWIGFSSYIISKKCAKYLLGIAKEKPLKCAIDAWTRNLYNDKLVDVYFTVPLMTCVPNIMDSDTTFN